MCWCTYAFISQDPIRQAKRAKQYIGNMRLFSLLTCFTYLLLPLCCLLPLVANGFNRKAWLKTPIDDRVPLSVSLSISISASSLPLAACI